MNYFLIDNFVYGGAERQASYIVNNYIGIDELILLENEIKYKLNGSIPVKSIHPKILKLIQRPVGDMITRRRLQKLFTSNDTVISFLERSNIINISTSFKTGHNAVISVRNYLSKKYNHPKYFYRVKLIKKYYPKASQIITNSVETKRDLVENFNISPNKIKVIYNIIDIDNVQKLKNESLPKEHIPIFKNPVILNIGSLTPQKSQNQLIEAFSTVNQKYPEYKLVIIGKGKLEKKLLRLIEKLNLKKEVFLLGNVSNPFKYLRYSDMFVLNSNYEGFPNVLLEALAVGTPIVTKNFLSGPKELLNIESYDNNKILLTDYGFIFPRSNYKKERKALVKSIIELIYIRKKDEELYRNLSRKSRKRAEDFSMDNVLKQWKSLLSKSD